jgi:hypothetical protein
LLYHHYKVSERESYFNIILSEFARSPSSFLRKSFLYFCSEAASVFANKIFIDLFFNDYCAKSDDSIASVRIAFLKTFIKVRKGIAGDLDSTHFLVELLHKMQEEDKDAYV